MSGNARIVLDSAVQERHKVNGKAPMLALVVDVTEAFMHCSKAFIRGRMWKPEQWPSLETVPSLAEWVKCVVSFPEDIKTVEGWHENDRVNRLY